MRQHLPITNTAIKGKLITMWGGVSLIFTRIYIYSIWHEEN